MSAENPAAPLPVADAPGRGHSPVIALLAALLVPGAGQSYNGQPVKGFFLLLLTPLVLPWIYAVIDAPLRAAKIRREGGRYGQGGCLWIVLHLWLFVNVALATVVGLTIAGVIT